MMALTQMTSLSLTNLHLLIQELGSAVTIYENRNDLRQVLPSASKKTLDGMGHFDTYLARAEQEMEFCRKGRIQCLGLNDEGYPQRLRDCNDAPILLYYRGTANLNTQHIVSMVGTRQITAYGKDLCRSFVRDLKRLCPDALVVSGLAYGVDVHCHRAALDEGLETVGVLAEPTPATTNQPGKAPPTSPSATTGRCGPSRAASSILTRRDATNLSSRTPPHC